jgi:hypothetical protein
MRLPEFTAEASLGTNSKHYVPTSGRTAGASARSLQPQLHTRFAGIECELAAIGCFLFNQCYYYNQNCLPPPRPPATGGGGGNGGAGPSPGPGSTHVVAVI